MKVHAPSVPRTLLHPRCVWDEAQTSWREQQSPAASVHLCWALPSVPFCRGSRHVCHVPDWSQLSTLRPLSCSCNTHRGSDLLLVLWSWLSISELFWLSRQQQKKKIESRNVFKFIRTGSMTQYMFYLGELSMYLRRMFPTAARCPGLNYVKMIKTVLHIYYTLLNQLLIEDDY